jgi:hypothetical protein
MDFEEWWEKRSGFWASDKELAKKAWNAGMLQEMLECIKIPERENSD